MPLKVKIRHLEEKDFHLQGKLAALELELDDQDELARAPQPLHYDLTVRLVGKDILVAGHLEMALDCECARCLKPFGYRLDKPVLQDDALDLTPYLREAILLEFPQHPLCQSDCEGLPRRAEASSQKTEGSGRTPKASAWAELNKLKF